MFTRVVVIPMLGLLAMIVPARASFTFYTDNGTFTSDVTAGGLDGSSITNFNLVSNSFQYVDIATGITFSAIKSDGTSHDTFTASGNAIKTTTGGDIIEITLPANVFAFGGNFTTPSTFNNLCFDQGGTGITCGNIQFISHNTTAFLGLIGNEPLNTIWIGPTGGSAITQINDFTVGLASSAPEVNSWIALGTGLILLGFLRRRAGFAGRSV
jgi:hypothetical protein